MSDIRQLLLHEDPFPDITFTSDIKSIGSVGNYHYLKVGLDGTGAPSNTCLNTAPPTFTQGTQYAQDMFPPWSPNWFGGPATLVDDALSAYYEWKIDDLTNMTYVDGTAAVGTWYPFSLSGKTMRLQYLGGPAGYYRLYIRKVGETGTYQVRYDISP